MTPQERRYLARLEARAGLLAPTLQTALLRAFAVLRLALVPADLERLIRAGDIDALLRLAFTEQLLHRAFFPVRERIRVGTLGNARVTLRHIPVPRDRVIGIAFDVFDPRIRTALQTLESGSLGVLQGAVREAARAHILAGLEAGLNPRTIATGLRGTVGLTAYQEGIIQNFTRALAEGDYRKALTYELRDKRFDGTLRRLLREGKRLTPAQIATYTDRYRTRFIARNAETVARTTALEAQRVGQQLAWAEAKASGALGDADVWKVWVHTEDWPDNKNAREHHFAMHHKTAPLEGVYENGDRWPGQADPWNCRCTETYRVVPRGSAGPRAA